MTDLHRTGLPKPLRDIAAQAAVEAHAEWAAKPAGHVNTEWLAYAAAVLAAKAVAAMYDNPDSDPGKENPDG